MNNCGMVDNYGRYDYVFQHVCIVRSLVCVVHFPKVNTITSVKRVADEMQTHRTYKTNPISG